MRSPDLVIRSESVRMQRLGPEKTCFRAQPSLPRPIRASTPFPADSRDDGDRADRQLTDATRDLGRGSTSPVSRSTSGPGCADDTTPGWSPRRDRWLPPCLRKLGTAATLRGWCGRHATAPGRVSAVRAYDLRSLIARVRERSDLDEDQRHLTAKGRPVGGAGTHLRCGIVVNAGICYVAS
jgi:hypothetical protein